MQDMLSIIKDKTNTLDNMVVFGLENHKNIGYVTFSDNIIKLAEELLNGKKSSTILPFKHLKLGGEKIEEFFPKMGRKYVQEKEGTLKVDPAHWDTETLSAFRFPYWSELGKIDTPMKIKSLMWLYY